MPSRPKRRYTSQAMSAWFCSEKFSPFVVTTVFFSMSGYTRQPAGDYDVIPLVAVRRTSMDKTTKRWNVVFHTGGAFGTSHRIEAQVEAPSAASAQAKASEGHNVRAMEEAVELTGEKQRWRVDFTGRRSGALGIGSKLILHVMAIDMAAARLACYETHEHITVHRIALAKEQTGPRCDSEWHTTARPSDPQNCPNCGAYAR